MTKGDIFDKLCNVEVSLEESLSFLRVLKADINESFKLSAKNIEEVPIKDFFSLKFDFTYPQNKSIIKTLEWMDINSVGDLCNNPRFASTNDFLMLRGMGKTKVAAIKSHLDRYGLTIGNKQENTSIK